MSAAGTEQTDFCPVDLSKDGTKIRLVALLVHPDSGSMLKVGMMCRNCKFVRWSDGTTTFVQPRDDEATASVRRKTEGMVQEGAVMLRKNPRAFERLWHYLATVVVDADQYLYDAAAKKRDEEG